MAISPQRLTIYLYSAHRAVIFAIAQLSCFCLVITLIEKTQIKSIADHGRSFQFFGDWIPAYIIPILRCLHWLKINERIEYKLLSLTYKVLTTSQPDYLHNLISVRSTCRTHSSSVVTLARPPVSSSLQITNRSFTYASSYLRNRLPSSPRQPHSVHSPPGSPHPAHITSS